MYATVNDLSAGWRDLSASERGIASALLARASAKLNERIILAGREPEQLTANQREIAKAIVCDAVTYTFNRTSAAGSMFTGEDPDIYLDGAVGGEVRITDAHMRQLGIGPSRAGFAR